MLIMYCPLSDILIVQYGEGKPPFIDIWLRDPVVSISLLFLLSPLLFSPVHEPNMESVSIFTFASFSVPLWQTCFC